MAVMEMMAMFPARARREQSESSIVVVRLRFLVVRTLERASSRGFRGLRAVGRSVQFSEQGWQVQRREVEVRREARGKREGREVNGGSELGRQGQWLVNVGMVVSVRMMRLVLEALIASNDVRVAKGTVETHSGRIEHRGEGAVATTFGVGRNVESTDFASDAQVDASFKYVVAGIESSSVKREVMRHDTAALAT